jgi:DNA (cytosine-5)-methyltransferase 1
MKINHLDLFSGIGGFHLGFERAGFKIKSYFSEIDKHAIAVYKHKFKDATYVGSVTDVRGEDLPRIDLITFGSPCQDFSLAGKRAGMGGDRSSLILEAIRLVRECRPRVFIWENVKGAFSSNAGEDFAAILQEFADIGGYRLEWQLLNTSWFLPQNRERIYLVGYSTTPKRGWRGVFPIRESGEQTNLRGINVIATSENDVQSRRVYGSDGIARTLTSGDYKSPMRVEVKQIGTRIDSGGKQPYQQDRIYDSTGHAPALNAGKSDLIVKEQYRIRRLTPIECERLQGFPDDHTSFGNYDGEVKPVSNTHRYKQCGNAVTVDVVSAVAKKCIPLFK